MKKLILLLFIPLVSLGQEDKDIKQIITEYNSNAPINYGNGVYLDNVGFEENTFYYNYEIEDCELQKNNSKSKYFLSFASNRILESRNNVNNENKWEIQTISENFDFLVYSYKCFDGSNEIEFRFKFSNGKYVLISDLDDLIK